MNNQVERRHDLDWLRFFAMCAVFFFHCARFFDYGGWHVKNIEHEFGMQIFVSILGQWIMPLFFVLSGLSTYYSLKNKEQTVAFIWARVKRLIIPLLFGIFTMIPLQVYCERVSHGKFQGSFVDFFPHYFDGFYGFGGNFAWQGLHLWYLLFLFIFTLISLPLFIWGRGKCGQGIISRLAFFGEKPGIIFLFFMPIAIFDFIFMPQGVGIRDMGGWNLFTYLLLFICGYLFAADTRFKKAIEHHRMTALIFSVISLSILYCWVVYLREPHAGYSLQYFLFALGRSFNSWCLVLTLLGYGSRYLTFSNILLNYVKPLILPFYILHQTVIITIGFYVVQWHETIAIKYLMISSSSFFVIMLLYELFIKRISKLRFLFGMKRIES